jgi:hypothetical protein
MHLGILPGLILALAGNFLGGAHNASGAAYQANSHDFATLYSILAQGTTTATIPATTTVQAAATLTSTSVITGSTPAAIITATNTITPATAVPLPTVGPQANLQINPFDWNFLTGTPTDPNKIGPFAIAFLVLMVALIGVGVYLLRVKRPQWKSSNPVLFKAVNRLAPYTLWIGVLGILFLLFRIIPLDFFNLRFWLYLIFLALIVLVVWVVYWYRTSYPKEMAKFLKTQKARQYMPGGGKVPSRSTPLAAPAVRTPPAKTGGTAKGSLRPSSSAPPTGNPGSKPAQQRNRSRKRR